MFVFIVLWMRLRKMFSAINLRFSLYSTFFTLYHFRIEHYWNWPWSILRFAPITAQTRTTQKMFSAIVAFEIIKWQTMRHKSRMMSIRASQPVMGSIEMEVVLQIDLSGWFISSFSNPNSTGSPFPKCKNMQWKTPRHSSSDGNNGNARPKTCCEWNREWVCHSSQWTVY